MAILVTARLVFYLCEISARMDSGMTLQVVHDYGRLCHAGWRVGLPVRVGDVAEWPPFDTFLRSNGITEAFPLSSRWRGARVVAVALRALWQGPQVVVIRERRHFALARVLRRLTGALLISELHEGAFPSGSERSHRRFGEFLRALDGIVFTNASQRDYLLQLGYTLPRQQIVLPNGVDYQRFSRTPHATSEPPFILTYAGQFTSWKNIELLFAALKRLDGRFRLRLAGGKAGSGSADLVATLSSRFAVDGRVDYLGFVHPEEVASRALAGSAVLLLPLGENTISRYATSPMKLIEYLATGIPVVAVGHPSVKALAGDDVAHLASGDAGEFAAAIRAAIDEGPAARSRRGERMKALAAQFDHVRRAERFDRWLSQLVPQ